MCMAPALPFAPVLTGKAVEVPGAAFLRLSTVRQWLALRAIGDDVGVGLRFCASARMEFREYIVWRRRLSGFLVTPGLCAMGGSNGAPVTPGLSLMGETE